MTRFRHAQRGNALLIILAIVLVIGGFLMTQYNGLVTQDTNVEQLAANIDSQLKRRADLIPNLVNTVKGYAAHEKGVFEDIAKARSQLLSADTAKNPAQTQEAMTNFNGALGRLLAIAENYPNLKADQGFIRLQDELAGTENRINYARIQYNEGIKQFNLSVRSFPTNIIAGMLGFERKEPFKATEAEKATPTVQF